jgi:hypothetical protein
VVDHPGRSGDGVGACTASRWPVLGVQQLDLHVGPRVDVPWAAAVAVEVAGPEPLGRVLVVHHMPTWQRDQEAERERQAVAVARWG